MEQFYKNEQASKSQLVFAGVILLLLVILGSLERIYGIDRQSLWSDELYAVTASYFNSYADVWKLMLGDSHPPGYLTFMYFTLPLTGYSDFGVRLHALLFGIAWIPLVFYLGNRWFSANTGLLAAALVASSYNAIYFSQEARAYTMLVTFCLINIICFFEILFAGSKLKRHSWGFIGSSTAMLYLHYTGFVFICTEMLVYAILWLAQKKKGSIREFLLLFCVPMLFYTPWLEVMYLNIAHEPRDWSVSKTPTFAEFCNTIQRLFGPDKTRFKLHIAALTLVFVGAVWASAKQGLTRKNLLIFSMLFLAAVPILVFLIKSLVSTPIFEKRYFLVAVPLAAIIIAVGIDFALQKMPAIWQSIFTVLLVVMASVFFININNENRLYSLLDKDPVREAVNIIAVDLGQKKEEKNYTVLMTHDWFEHYLRRSAIAYDGQWKYRHYYVPQESEKVDIYLAAHPELEYFYYLSLREPNAVAALVPLKQTYKLLDKHEASIEQGAIDIYKFSAKEKPDEKQLSEVGSNPSNEIAKLVATALRGKDPASYGVLWTHEWIRPYLQKNGLQLAESEINRAYVVDVQVEGIFTYIQAHPEVDTLYYLALREPNAEGAALMLQTRYRLVSEQSVRVSVGDMDILRFDLKAEPVVSASSRRRLESSPTHEAIASLSKAIATLQAETLLVLASHPVFEPYVEQYGGVIDKAWGGDAYYLQQDKEKFLAYLAAHPEKQQLFYLAVIEPTLQPTIEWLKGQYYLSCEQGADLAVGRVSLMQFDLTKPPGDRNNQPVPCSK